MIRQELQDVFRATFADPTLVISDGTTAADVAGWDSLTHIRLVVAVEKHFKVKFRNAEVARLKNVGDLVNLIMKYRPEGRAAA